MIVKTLIDWKDKCFEPILMSLAAAESLITNFYSARYTQNFTWLSAPGDDNVSSTYAIWAKQNCLHQVANKTLPLAYMYFGFYLYNMGPPEAHKSVVLLIFLLGHCNGASEFAFSINEPCHEKTCFSHMQTTKAQISLRIRAVWSAPLLFAAWIV